MLSLFFTKKFRLSHEEISLIREALKEKRENTKKELNEFEFKGMDTDFFNLTMKRLFNIFIIEITRKRLQPINNLLERIK